MKAAFEALDKDGDGSISHEEFRDGLQALGVSLPVNQVCPRDSREHVPPESAMTGLSSFLELTASLDLPAVP